MKWVVAAAICMMPHVSKAADRGFALVVGNGSYVSARLHTPVADATSVADALNVRGFAVTSVSDMPRERLLATLTAFGDAIKGTDRMVVVYFAGHGIQVNGVNYLIPTDASVRRPVDVPSAAVSLDRVLDVLRMAASSAPKILILDACRSNPFATESPTEWVPGLAPPSQTLSNGLIAYSTQPGNIAADGVGRHSPFTRSLLDHLGDPGVPIERLLKTVREDTRHATDAIQEPAEFSSLTTQDVFITPAASVTARIIVADDDAVILVNGAEVTEWNNDGAVAKHVVLHAGSNPVIIKVYNQRSYTGGIPGLGGHLPEGWRYAAEFKRADGTTLTSIVEGEDRPDDNGPHHGKLFTVETFDLVYDPATMIVSIDNQRRVW